MSQILKYKINQIHNLKMALRVDDPGISRVLAKPLGKRQWHREPEFMDVLADNILPEDVFLDIGCNIGYVSLYVLSRLSNSGALYAVEPDPSNIKAFQTSLSMNSSLSELVKSCDQLALSDFIGESEFELSEKSNLHRLKQGSLGFQSLRSIKVPVTTFDEYFRDKKYPTFIKMDVEGAELSVFRGMKKFLETDHPCKILLELHPDYYRLSPEDSHAAFKLLFDHGFRVDTFASASLAEPKPLLDKGYYPFEKYKTGSWGRGLYRNVKTEDFMDFVLNNSEFAIKLNWRDAIKQRRMRIQTSKIARAALLIKT